MGWKTSIVVGRLNQDTCSDQEILESIDLEEITFVKKSFLDECMTSAKSHISIGKFNGKTVICAPQRLLRTYLNKEQQSDNFLSLFSGSELLMAACNSTTQFHAYTLFSKGLKKRFKSISLKEEKEEWGDILNEEKSIYNEGFVEDGKYYWNSEDTKQYEHQLMEDFTFQVLKRELGVNLMTDEGEVLMEDTAFNTYEIEFKNNYRTRKKYKKWVLYVVFFLLFIAWQILVRIYNF